MSVRNRPETPQITRKFGIDSHDMSPVETSGASSGNCARSRSSNPDLSDEAGRVTPPQPAAEQAAVYDIGTRAVHAGYKPSDNPAPACVVPPLYMSTNYDRTVQSDFNYSRNGNPGRSMLEMKLAALEGSKYAAAFASGMATVSAIVTACCPSGTHAVVASDMYGGTVSYFKTIAPGHGVQVTWLDDSDLVEAIGRSIRPETTLVWIETMSNPMLTMVDIEATAAVVAGRRKATEGRRHPLYVAVDNTFMTPFFCNPLKLGADLVFHAASKYLNGHGDALVGAVLFDDNAFCEKFRWIQETVGAVPVPFECYMVMRGIKTFHLRMKQHMETSLALAKFLAGHPCVSGVLHPGLPEYKFKELLEKQCRGYAGMMSFMVKGSLDDARRFVANLKVAIHAASLGGCETLVGLPYDLFAKTLNDSGTLPYWARIPNLVRVSVGLESVRDLIADFDQSLRRSVSVKPDDPATDVQGSL